MAVGTPFDDGAWAAAQESGQHVDLEGGIFRGLGVPQQCPREIGDGVVARTEIGDPPGRAGLVELPELECFEKAGLHQGGLAAARGAQHGDEARRGQPVDDLVDIAFAAEEQVRLVTPEGAKAGIGRAHRHAAPSFSSASARFSPSAPTLRSSGRLMPIASTPSGGSL